jgi:hypothetical protein
VARAKPLSAQGFATRQHKAKEKLRAKAFVALCKQHGLPEPELEYQIVKDRKYRWDFAWPLWRVALECNGGVWSGGAHGRRSGILRDYEKANLAAVLDWLCLYTTPDQLCTSETLTMLELTLKVAA